MTNSPKTPIDRAVVPAAGYGTRLRPLTLAIPKEMLPLGRKPVLEYVLEELRDAGIRKVLFVVSPGKELIQRYFGDGSNWGVECDYVLQPDMKGLGDALLKAEQWCGGRSTMVAFGDCVIESHSSTEPNTRASSLSGPTLRMLETHHEKSADAVVLAQRVSPEKVSKYGILCPHEASSTGLPFQVASIVEKPAPDEAPSDLAVSGRWIIGSKVFELLRSTPYGNKGELSLTDAIAKGLQQRLGVWAVPLHSDETRRDIGGWETYLGAAADYALGDEEFGSAIREALSCKQL